MTRIFGWAADGDGCGYYRVFQPLGELSRRGHETHADQVMPVGWYCDEAAVVLGQRVCNEQPSARWQELASAGRRLVFELDDNLWEIDARATVGGHHRFFFQPEVKRRLRENIAAASLVTVTTPHLAGVVAKYNADVRVIPNSVPSWLVEHERPRAERLTIGWAGSAYHLMDWEEVANPIRQFVNRNQGFDIHMMGVDWAKWLRLPADRCRFTRWTAGVEDYYRLVDFDIGIAPLRPHVFNRGKSPIKALEYAALGIPVVASDVGPYSDFVKDGETGFLVNRPHEWAQKLRILVNDADMRAEMGAKARAHAANWTVERVAPLWEDALCAA